LLDLVRSTELGNVYLLTALSHTVIAFEDGVHLYQFASVEGDKQ